MSTDAPLSPSPCSPLPMSPPPSAFVRLPSPPPVFFLLICLWQESCPFKLRVLLFASASLLVNHRFCSFNRTKRKRKKTLWPDVGLKAKFSPTLKQGGDITSSERRHHISLSYYPPRSDSLFQHHKTTSAEISLTIPLSIWHISSRQLAERLSNAAHFWSPLSHNGKKSLAQPPEE